MPRIDEIFAFVTSADGSPDDEGIIGAQTRNGWMPLVGADRARIESFRPIAETVARETGLPVRLIRFREREDLETIAPSEELP